MCANQLTKRHDINMRDRQVIAVVQCSMYVGVRLEPLYPVRVAISPTGMVNWTPPDLLGVVVCVELLDGATILLRCSVTTGRALLE